ncbi:MAG: hypothetical protein WCA64_05320 [Gallionella sp.]
MKLPALNIFIAWFMIPQTLAMGWLAALGRLTMELFGTDSPEEGIPGRIVGALLLLGAVFVVRRLFGGTLPIVGNPDGNGYLFGHRLILTGNILAAALFVFQLAWHWIPSAAAVMVLAQFTSAFGYWVMALWAMGFSFLYQSTQVT